MLGTLFAATYFELNTDPQKDSWGLSAQGGEHA
jgi:hypothetical protein